MDLGLDLGGLGARLRVAGMAVRMGLPLCMGVLDWAWAAPTREGSCCKVGTVTSRTGFDSSVGGLGRGVGRCEIWGAALRASKRERREDTAF